MCNCRGVVLEDVAYRGVGVNAVPYHKVCGDWLSDQQIELVERQRAVDWPRAWAESFRLPKPRAMPDIQRCPDCGGMLVEVKPTTAATGFWCRECNRLFVKPVKA